MFVLTNNVSAAFRVIATLVATAVVLWTIGYHATAEAANVIDVTDTLSDSSPDADSDHLIEFTMSASGTVATGGGTIVVTFPTDTGNFDLTGVVEADIDLEVNSVDQDISGPDWTVAVGASTITFTAVGSAVGEGEDVLIQVGTNAAGGANQINNPPAIAGNESFEIDISAGTDTGHTRVVILDTVLVTATVDTTFDFTVYGNGTGEAVNGTTTNITTGSTSIPFGTLTAYAIKTGSQDLTVRTNAIGGFVVTVQSDGAFLSSTGADIDTYEDGDDTVIPETWASPSVGLDIGDQDTWGHWGITSEDATTTRANEFGSDQWAAVLPTPIVVYSHSGPADEVTPHIGSTTVGYQVEISPLQEAGDDYSTILTYIATPKF